MSNSKSVFGIEQCPDKSHRTGGGGSGAAETVSEAHRSAAAETARQKRPNPAKPGRRSRRLRRT